MLYQLKVAGPGLDVLRQLRTGEAPLVLGRDIDCDICLPDPQRTVSRRHLHVWVEGGELRFHVVSEVNGIGMAFGEAPPGARGVLPEGETLQVGEYALGGTKVEDAPDADVDPWAVFDGDASGVAPPASDAPPVETDEDPFGEWGFQSTFAPQAAGGAALDAAGLVPGDLASFFRGLGIEGQGPVPATAGELEAMGRLVRMLAVGVLHLQEEVAGVKEDLHAEDRTTLAPRETNPLASGWPVEAKLRYLFGGLAATAGVGPQERWLRDLLAGLAAHNTASGLASRAVVRETLHAFEPGRLKERLLGDASTRLFESSRAWDAFCKHFAQESADIERWTQRQLDRHFTEAYVRESTRIRRETGSA